MIFQLTTFFSSWSLPQPILTLSAWAHTISDLMNKSESDSNIPIEWFKKNKVTVNPDKFQAIVLNKKSSDLTNIKFQVDSQVIKSLSSVELLGIQIEDKLVLIYRLANL